MDEKVVIRKEDIGTLVLDESAKPIVGRIVALQKEKETLSQEAAKFHAEIKAIKKLKKEINLRITEIDEEIRHSLPPNPLPPKVIG